MDPIARFVDHSLRAHEYPALRLAELVALVAESLDRGMDAPRLLAVVRAYPTCFRVLEPWAGPWATPEARTAIFAPGESWVAALDAPNDLECGAPSALLRESVRWLGRGTDARSVIDVTRWHAIVLAQRGAAPPRLRLVA